LIRLFVVEIFQQLSERGQVLTTIWTDIHVIANLREAPLALHLDPYLRALGKL